MSATVDTINSLGWTLLQNTGADSGKVLSPLSLTVAIAMLAGGGDAEKQRALCTQLGVQSLSSLAGAMSDVLSSAQSDESLVTANAAFIDSTVTLKQPYKAYLTTFNAQTTQFNSLAESVDAINTWISDNTHGIIRDMLAAAQLKKTHIALVNTIAFKGTWATSFNAANTVDWPFQPSRKLVPMMRLFNTKIRTRKTDKFTAVQLPYKSRTSLLAFLPAGDVMDILDEIKSFRVSNSRFLPLRYDELGLPKFELTSDLSALDALQQAGYPVLGNYPEMASGTNLVEKVLHRAFVKVDEEGTTAAAATAILMSRSMAVRKERLIFDKPFAFAIVDERSLVLFSGIYRV